MLVIDDSMMSYRFIEASFEPLGYKLIHARSGESGLEVLRLVRPDLILLDMIMDGMDGIETCRKIKSQESLKDIPVIFLTSAEGQDSLQQAFEVGAVDYVVKKFNPAEMIARVQTQVQLLESKRQLLEERDRAEKLSQQKSEFLSVVAHDLKNPLAGIAGFADILKDQFENPQEGIDEDSGELLESIIGSADHMLSIINDLVVSQTLESVEANLDTQVFNLAAIAKEVVEMNQAQARKKDIEINFDLGEDCVAAVDLSRIREIMDNLVNNAVKYSPLGKRVFVALGESPQDPGRIRFEVRDEGVGLTEDDKEKVFGKFQKLSAKPTGDETSTGLGLSIVKTYVEMHGGSIWVESEHQEGATFIFELDRASTVKA